MTTSTSSKNWPESYCIAIFLIFSGDFRFICQHITPSNLGILVKIRVGARGLSGLINPSIIKALHS